MNLGRSDESAKCCPFGGLCEHCVADAVDEAEHQRLPEPTLSEDLRDRFSPVTPVHLPLRV